MNLSKRFLVITLLLVGIFVGVLIRNPKRNSFQTCVINSLRIKSEARPFVRVRQLLEEHHQRIHNEISREEEHLRQEYERLKTSLETPSVLHKNRQDFDKKVTDLQKRIQEKQDRLNRQFAQMTERIEHELDQIIKELVEKKGFQMILNSHVFDKKVVFYIESSKDMTEEVIQHLNERLSKIEMPSVG